MIDSPGLKVVSVQESIMVSCCLMMEFMRRDIGFLIVPGNILYENLDIEKSVYLKRGLAR